MKIQATLGQWQWQAEKALHALSAVVIVILMVLMGVDIFLRWVVGIWIPGKGNVAEQLMLVTVFAGLAYTQAMGGHIQAQLLVARLSPRAAAGAKSFSNLVNFVAFATIFWLGYNMTWELKREGLVIMGELDWPLWPFYLSIPVGSFLYCLRTVARLVEEVNLVRRSQLERRD